MKLHMQLETLFGARFNSNAEIIATIKKLSEAGKFDEPKKVAVFAVILDRLGKMEDEIEQEKSLTGLDPIPDDGVNLDVVGETTGNPPENAVISETEANQLTNPTTPEIDTPPSASSDIPATPETPEAPAVVPAEAPDTPAQPEVAPELSQEPTASVETQPVTPTDPTPSVTNPVDTTPTVSNFTPENITDPQPTPDSTT